MSKLLMSHGFSLPVKCVFDEDGVPFQIDDSYGDLLIDGESTCEETNYELVAHAINSHDQHVQRIVDLETDRNNAISQMSKSWSHASKSECDILTRYVTMAEKQFEIKNQQIADLERQLEAEREINDRLRVVETERAVRNDELYEVLGETVGALYSSYDATEWPADGTSHQEVTALKGEATLEKHRDEYGERPVRYIAVHPNGTTSGFHHETKEEVEKLYKSSMSDWEIIPIRVSGDCDDSH